MKKSEALYDECRKLSDDQLIRELEELAACQRCNTVRILVRLSEAEKRQLVQKRGYSSVFMFCIRKLKYSESNAYKYTKAAEACRRFTFLIDLIEEGKLSLSAVLLIAPHLTRENCRNLAGKALGKSTREIERLIAPFSPVAAPRERVEIIAVRKIDSTTNVVVHTSNSDANLQDSLPLANNQMPPSESPQPEFEFRAKRSFTCSEEVEKMIERAMQLLWHKYPYARFEDILREALERLLDQIDPDRLMLKRSSRKSRESAQTRRVPKHVRNQVWKRDGGSCSFIGTNEQPCGERTGIEYDHIKPWALGGRSDDAENIRLLCWAHNQSCAIRQFGGLVPRRPA